MRKVTSTQFAALRHDLGMTAAAYGKLYGFGAAAHVRVYEIENEKRPISHQVETIYRLLILIYRLLIFLRKHSLLEKFLSE